MRCKSAPDELPRLFTDYANVPEARARALDILRVDVAVAVLVEALGERLLEYLGEEVESE